MKATNRFRATAGSQLRRVRGKSTTDVVVFAAGKLRKTNERRVRAARVRSPWMLAIRLAEKPAVKYSVLSDPRALELILNSEKGRELVRLASPSAAEPDVSQFLSLLANQPERLAEFLERDDVRSALLSSGVSIRTNLGWLVDLLQLGDPRTHDLLIDIATENASAILDDQRYRRSLFAGLVDPSVGPERLVGFLADLERSAPGALHAAGYARVPIEFERDGTRIAATTQEHK